MFSNAKVLKNKMNIKNKKENAVKHFPLIVKINI